MVLPSYNRGQRATDPRLAPEFFRRNQPGPRLGLWENPRDEEPVRRAKASSPTNNFLKAVGSHRDFSIAWGLGGREAGAGVSRLC